MGLHKDLWKHKVGNIKVHMGETVYPKESNKIICLGESNFEREFMSSVHWYVASGGLSPKQKKVLNKMDKKADAICAHTCRAVRTGGKVESECAAKMQEIIDELWPGGDDE